MKTSEVACPSCGAQAGEKCCTPVSGVDTQWDHDTRILRAMFTDPFATIPNASDEEYAGTVLETRRERQYRAASTPEEGE